MKNIFIYKMIFLRILDTPWLLFLWQCVTTWRFQPIKKQFIYQMVSISVAQWVKLSFIYRHVPSLNTAGTFVYKNSGKILILFFYPKIFKNFMSFSIQTQMLEIISLSNLEVRACMQNFSQRCEGPFSGPCMLCKR